MNHKRVSPMCATIHGKIYVFGGYSGTQRPTQIEYYDDANNTFKDMNYSLSMGIGKYKSN